VAGGCGLTDFEWRVSVPRLVGRRRECGVLAGLLAEVRAGRSAALVLRGEAGVGKTALLDYVFQPAADLRVVRVTGVESEMELSFAALHQMLGPVLDRLGQLPGPQREALEVAFGLREGPAPNRFLAGLAVLSLLSEVAADHPLVCVIDDAQWLDQSSARVLGFAARRLLAESVLVIFATREPGADLYGLPELAVEGLPDADARELLGSVAPWALDERVAEQIVAETQGNPLALIELPRGLPPVQLAGGFGLPQALSVPGRVEESFVRRVQALPAPTRLLLTIAAADPTGDPALVWRAAGRLGIPAAAAAPLSAEAGLAEIGARVRFRHPLVRSAAYQSASARERQDAHRALAGATDPDTDPGRRLWHRAQAAPGPDERVAAELEHAAGKELARGCWAAAGAFLERAVGLTPDPGRRASRALSAAKATVRAGAFGSALAMLGIAEAGPIDELQHAHADMIRAELAFVSSRGRDAPPLLLAAAARLEPIDIPLARATYLETINAALLAGHLSSPDTSVLAVSRAARAAPPAPGPPRPPDLLLDGLAASFCQGYRAGVPLLHQALAAFDHQVPAEEELRWLRLACVAALHLWDDSRWDELSGRHVDLARQAGALGELPLALTSRVNLLLFAGELTTAASLAHEAQAVTKATGSGLASYATLFVAALRGNENGARALIDSTGQDAAARGEGLGVTLTRWADAMLGNSQGRYDQALAAAEQASRHSDELGPAAWSMAELIEAAARTRQPQRATDALRYLSQTATAAGTDWALGVLARSVALLGDGNSAEEHYLEAIERLGRTRVRLELARAHLLYGEWLRRDNRRVDARAQLRTAHEMFTSITAGAFAERARRELLATGETVRKRTADTREELTPQEQQIARRARNGHSNAEIGAELFLSPRTVEWHLRKVFTKLNITSRRQLRQALPGLDIARPA
jgi:DNA-binding CsgD family transcriptional regulator/tetratricopeptide (TPR) repeat protein